MTSFHLYLFTSYPFKEIDLDRMRLNPSTTCSREYLSIFSMLSRLGEAEPVDDLPFREKVPIQGQVVDNMFQRKVRFVPNPRLPCIDVSAVLATPLSFANFEGLGHLSFQLLVQLSCTYLSHSCFSLYHDPVRTTSARGMSGCKELHQDVQSTSYAKDRE